LTKNLFTRTIIILVIISFLSGLLAALSLPPIGFWEAAFVANIIFFYIMQSHKVSKHTTGFLLGFSFAAGQFSLSLFWTNHFTSFGYVILLIVESLFFAVASYISPPNHQVGVIALPALFCLAEYARDNWPFGGLPIGSLILGQANGPLINLARLGGPIAIAFYLYLVSSLIAYALHYISAHRRLATALSLDKLIKTASCIAVLAGIVTYSFFAPDGGKPSYYVRAVAIQGGGKRGLGYIAKQIAPMMVFTKTIEETDKIIASRHPQLILWPEDVVSVENSIADSPLTGKVKAEARKFRATLIAGFVAPDGPKHFYNKLVAISSHGKIIGEFEKVHLVPFGEYIPDRSFFSKFADLSAVPKDAIRGHGSGMLQTGLGKLALLISYETFFTDRGRSGVNAGGGILLVSTNTASYSSSQVPSQELAASQIQAVAEGRALLQTATTGYSAWITPRGQVLKSSTLGKPDIIYANLGYRNGKTIYDIFGSFPIIATATLLFIIAFIIQYRDRHLEEG